MTLSQMREKIRSGDTVWYFGVDDDVTPIAGKIKAVFHWRTSKDTRLEVQALLSPGSPRRILPIYAVFATKDDASKLRDRVADAIECRQFLMTRDRFLTIRTAIMIDQFEKDMAVSGDEKTTASPEDLGNAAKAEPASQPSASREAAQYPAMIREIRRMAVSLQAMPDAPGPTVTVSEADLLAILDTYQGNFQSDREFRAYVRLLGECPHWCTNRPWEVER